MGRDFRIIIAGGRKFDNYESLKKAVDDWKKSKRFKADDKVTIVCGCADGADELGRKYAIENNWEVKEFPANWKLLGKCAGILRNKEMAKFASESESKDGMLFAFWNGKSKGTQNMIDTAIQHELPVSIFSYKDPEYNTESIIGEYLTTISEDMKNFVTDFVGWMWPAEHISENKGDTFLADMGDKNISVTVKNI